MNRLAVGLGDEHLDGLSEKSSGCFGLVGEVDGEKFADRRRPFRWTGAQLV